jgi:uncharacterized protein YaeQ
MKKILIVALLAIGPRLAMALTLMPSKPLTSDQASQMIKLQDTIRVYESILQNLRFKIMEIQRIDIGELSNQTLDTLAALLDQTLTLQNKVNQMKIQLGELQ